MVKEPWPSISSLTLDMPAYCRVVVALTSPRVPYTWSMGATRVGRTEGWFMLTVMVVVHMESLD